ncbi:hypothetical protein UlMin_003743 [Ulmus minor]
MDSKIESFIKVWIIAIASLCYYEPQNSLWESRCHSLNLGAPTAFFLVWLCSFKLLLFSFDQGPLSSSLQTHLFHFITIACLPIKIKQNPSHQNLQKSHPKSQISSKVPKSLLLTLKISTLVLIITLYQYRQYLHQYTMIALYCLHMYLGNEIVLALTAIPVQTLLGFEIEPHFDEPYLSTSLQDLWGRRWNLISGGGPYFVIAVFVVSRLMHEAIYYYLSRAKPTWEGTCFLFSIGEVAGERGSFRWVVFVFLEVTTNWLLFPHMLRNGVDEKAIKEYVIVQDFVKARKFSILVPAICINLKKFFHFLFISKNTFEFEFKIINFL